LIDVIRSRVVPSIMYW